MREPVLESLARRAPLPSGRVECHEEVVRDDEAAPCDKLAVAVRMDPNEGEPYPVCSRHARGVMVPLERVVNAAKVEALRDAKRFAAEHPIVTRAEVERLHASIEALADEWEAEAGRADALVDTARRDTERAGVAVHARQLSRAASALRALLSTDDETAGA